eukprot:GFUD01019416.1.p1 GENE.GFUD01019416.1~~GFUD01019416.1.p1  ORF type:complete len:222 (+),score=12.73 GFUD01019416.1:78-743(+)
MRIFVALPLALCFLLLLPEAKAQWWIGDLPQRVFIMTRYRQCTGTMITTLFAITSGRCVSNRTKDSDVVVYPPQKKCDSKVGGIPACKVEHQYTGEPCTSSGYDIALVRLSRRMLYRLTQDIYDDPPTLGTRTRIAGTDECYGYQWYCTNGHYKQLGCSGDSGGPTWTYTIDGKDKVLIYYWITHNDKGGQFCSNEESRSSNNAVYQPWIEWIMAGPLARC